MRNFTVEDIETILFHPLHKMSQQAFPPHNILMSKDGSQCKIQLAVSGFTKDDISVELEDGRLKLRGNTPEVDVSNDWDVQYKGIAARKFELSFVVNRNFDVKEAYMQDGLMVVLLEKVAGFAKKITVGTKPIPTIANEKQLLNESK